MLRTAFGDKLTHMDSMHLIFELRRPLNENSNEMTAKQKSPLLFKHHVLALPVTINAHISQTSEGFLLTVYDKGTLLQIRQ